MLESQELNISEITRRAGVSHNSVSRHLDFLKKSKILTEKRFNHIRIFRLEEENPMVEVLSRFMSDWKNANIEFAS